MRRGLVDPDEKISISEQCALLSVSRSSLYYKENLEKIAEEAWLMNRLRDLWMETPFYGYRKLNALLNREGYSINHKRTQRILRKLGLKAITCTRSTSIKNLEHEIYPYLLKDIHISTVNIAWQVDISYIPMQNGFAYLIALIDVFSRYCVAHNVSISMETDFCLHALHEGLKQAKPLIVNTDQGCQFTSTLWVESLKSQQIQISMVGKGRCIDNVYIERLWRTIKYEGIFLSPVNSVSELKRLIKEFVHFYNHKRLHQALNYHTPHEIYTRPDLLGALPPNPQGI